MKNISVSSALHFLSHLVIVVSVAACLGASGAKLLICLMNFNKTYVFAENFNLKFEQKNMIVKELPHLGITLKQPIKNAMYQDDGIVNSIVEHEIKLHKEFGFKVNNIKRIKEKSGSASGICETFMFEMADGGKKTVCTTFMLKQKSHIQTIATRAHEEMHVVQNLKIDEAFDDLKKRFREHDYIIDWKKFSIEEQAIIVSLLRVWETGLRIDKTETQLFFNIKYFEESWRKLTECKINDFDKILNFPVTFWDIPAKVSYNAWYDSQMH